MDPSACTMYIPRKPEHAECMSTFLRMFVTRRSRLLDRFTRHAKLSIGSGALLLIHRDSESISRFHVAAGPDAREALRARSRQQAICGVSQKSSEPIRVRFVGLAVLNGVLDSCATTTIGRHDRACVRRRREEALRYRHTCRLYVHGRRDMCYTNSGDARHDHERRVE